MLLPLVNIAAAARVAMTRSRFGMNLPVAGLLMIPVSFAACCVVWRRRQSFRHYTASGSNRHPAVTALPVA
jgi:ribose/xylose/arabinose/galactoside ABC-type transport system permease subunit